MKNFEEKIILPAPHKQTNIRINVEKITIISNDSANVRGNVKEIQQNVYSAFRTKRIISLTTVNLYM